MSQSSSNALVPYQPGGQIAPRAALGHGRGPARLGAVDHHHRNDRPDPEPAEEQNRRRIAPHQKMREGPERETHQHRVADPLAQRAFRHPDPEDVEGDQHQQVVEVARPFPEDPERRARLGAAIAPDHEEDRGEEHDTRHTPPLLAHLRAMRRRHTLPQMPRPPERDAENEDRQCHFLPLAGPALRYRGSRR